MEILLGHIRIKAANLYISVVQCKGRFGAPMSGRCLRECIVMDKSLWDVDLQKKKKNYFYDDASLVSKLIFVSQ